MNSKRSLCTVRQFKLRLEKSGYVRLVLLRTLGDSPSSEPFTNTTTMNSNNSTQSL